jgi:hypothetical protein
MIESRGRHMEQKFEKALSGFDNKRLNKVQPTNSEETAAWANTEKKISDSKVNIPSEYEIEKAKNWVDNGSKL